LFALLALGRGCGHCEWDYGSLGCKGVLVGGE
jgi:hypothetical protein